MTTDCPDCKPGATTRAFTAEDYQRALEVLAARTDLDEPKRNEVRAYVDDYYAKHGVADPG